MLQQCAIVRVVIVLQEAGNTREVRKSVDISSLRLEGQLEQEITIFYKSHNRFDILTLTYSFQDVDAIFLGLGLKQVV